MRKNTQTLLCVPSTVVAWRLVAFARFCLFQWLVRAEWAWWGRGAPTPPTARMGGLPPVRRGLKVGRGLKVRRGPKVRGLKVVTRWEGDPLWKGKSQGTSRIQKFSRYNILLRSNCMKSNRSWLLWLSQDRQTGFVRYFQSCENVEQIRARSSWVYLFQVVRYSSTIEQNTSCQYSSLFFCTFKHKAKLKLEKKNNLRKTKSLLSWPPPSCSISFI